MHDVYEFSVAWCPGSALFARSLFEREGGLTPAGEASARLRLRLPMIAVFLVAVKELDSNYHKRETE